MKKYKLIYEKAGSVYGSESGIPSVNDDKFECTAKEGYLYGFDYKPAKPETLVVEPVVEKLPEVAVDEPVTEVEPQPQPKKSTKKKAAPVVETVVEETAE